MIIFPCPYFCSASSCICLWGFTNVQVMYGGLVFGGEGICSQSGFALPSTTIGIASVMLCLLLPFCFCIVNAWGTDWGSLTTVFASAHVS